MRRYRLTIFPSVLLFMYEIIPLCESPSLVRPGVLPFIYSRVRYFFLFNGVFNIPFRLFLRDCAHLRSYLLFIHLAIRIFVLRLSICDVIYYFHFIIRIFAHRLFIHSPIRFFTNAPIRAYIRPFIEDLLMEYTPISPAISPR